MSTPRERPDVVGDSATDGPRRRAREPTRSSARGAGRGTGRAGNAAGGTPSTEARPSAPTPQPKHFLRDCLMVLLSDQPAYGYQLIRRLATFELDRDRGRVYRALRELEDDGIVSSAWIRSDIGPARRMYELTPVGAAALRDAVQALQASAVLIERFLDLYQIGESRRLWLRHHPAA